MNKPRVAKIVTRTVGGTKLRSETRGRWATEDGRFTFHKNFVVSRCESPHPSNSNHSGYCFGDSEHKKLVWEARDGDVVISGAERFKYLSEVVKFALSHSN